MQSKQKLYKEINIAVLLEDLLGMHDITVVPHSFTFSCIVLYSSGD